MIWLVLPFLVADIIIMACTIFVHIQDTYYPLDNGYTEEMIRKIHEENPRWTLQ
jgi:hypothetical protein